VFVYALALVLFLDSIKPPIPVEASDILNFSRLALALTEGSQILWHFKHKGRHVLGMFTAYMYWDGDLPILAYTYAESPPKPFLAYKCDSPKGEEWMFTDDADDSRYRYGSFVQVKSLPGKFLECLDGQFPSPPAPMLAEVESINSIMRTLVPLSMREGTVFPLWHFVRDSKHVLGTCIPFEHYYEADALPVFFYLIQEKPPPAAFVKYIASKPTGEKIDYTSNTTDAKGFYAKIVDVKDFPIFP